MDARDSSLRSWLHVLRLGLVQTALGALVVLTTSTLNRVMVVELLLPAALPGALVGCHYAVQLARPRWGYGSDRRGSRVPWILGGMAVLAAGAIAASASTLVLERSVVLGTVAAFVAFVGIGVGVGAAGTNLLALLATTTAPSRKAAAAAVVWIMMIAGFVITASLTGRLLDPFSLGRLVGVTSGVAGVALAVTALAVAGVRDPESRLAPDGPPPAFRKLLAEIWAETESRRFTVFVFVSMFAYSAQDLILEPFAGLVHGFTPGESTRLAGVQHGGVLLGMVAAAVAGTRFGGRGRFARLGCVIGCGASALALAALATGATVGPAWPLRANVFVLGVANGAFAVTAIGAMMTLASAGAPGREGTRLGVWGAAQGIAFGLGGFLGAAAVDVARALLPEPGTAFALVFGAEALLFVAAAQLASRVVRTDGAAGELRPLAPGRALAAK